MKFSSFRYDTSVNLGDQVQSFAAEQFLPRLDAHIDRDSLNQLSGPDQTLVIMNSWFSDKPENWPPSEAVTPLFFGFHATYFNGARERFVEPDSLAYLKTQEPIGCRDRGTRDWFRAHGIDAYYSKCLTLTLPRREREPEDGKVFLVDVEYYPVKRSLRHRGVKVSQMTVPHYDDETKRQMMRQLLDTYKNQASLVVTSKLHCAMPCLAMGIPVVFIGKPDDYRTEILRDVGLQIQPYRLPKNKVLRLLKWALYEYLGLGYVRKDVWRGQALDLETEKASIRGQLAEQFQRRVGRRTEMATPPSPTSRAQRRAPGAQPGNAPTVPGTTSR